MRTAITVLVFAATSVLDAGCDDGNGTQAKQAILDVKVTSSGGFSKEYPWEATARPTGRVDLTVRGPKEEKSVITMERKWFQKLAETVSDSRFDDLPDTIGHEVPDCAALTVVITKSDSTKKSVSILFVGP